jgi:hypothetical protein
MKSVEELLHDEAETRLRKTEREAYSRFMRVRADVNDGALTEAAEKLWKTAAAALQGHQTRRDVLTSESPA